MVVEPPHPCAFCDKEFDTVDEHTRHVWNNHNGRGLPIGTQKRLKRKEWFLKHRGKICFILGIAVGIAI
jgi:uncharacterized C2H2 Zn-finger protein